MIVTSGEAITPFFLNGERVIPNWDKRGVELTDHNPLEMAKFVYKALQNEEFFNLMNNIKIPEETTLISGGQTRDWPFAAALAAINKLPFLAIYKPQNNKPMQLIQSGKSEIITDLREENAYHIVDLTTTASSIVREGGWQYQVSRAGGNMLGVYAIIDRNQGAGEILGERGLTLNSKLKLDGKTLRSFDPKNSAMICEYLRDPRKWTNDYLSRGGNLGRVLGPYLDPNNPMSRKDDRLNKLLQNYEEFRAKVGRLRELYS